MWKIKQIFDGDYGCEELQPGQKPKVSVTLVDDAGNPPDACDPFLGLFFIELLCRLAIQFINHEFIYNEINLQ